MDVTPNFAIPIPKEGNSVADEFYHLMVAMGVVDDVLKAILDNANGRAPLEHTQAISTIIGLVDELAGKMPADRVFKLDDLIDVEGADGAPAGYIVVKNGAGQWVPSSALAALGTHGHLMSEITGLAQALSDRVLASALGDAAYKNTGTAAGTVAAGDDARMTNSREWTGATISQAEAEAGTATTRRAFTAQRVRQAIVAVTGALVSQADAEAGTSTAVTTWTAQRVAQAIAALAPTPVYQDVTASRTHTTVYQNTTGKPITVQMALTLTASSSSGNSSAAALETSPDNSTWHQNAGDAAIGGLSAANKKTAFEALVPNGFYYRLTRAVAGSATYTINRWGEVR